MKKLDIKGIFTRPRKLLLHPETEWRENIEGIELFKNFLVPLSVLSSACAILLRLLSTSPLYAIGTGIILFMASIVGSYIAYRVSREYLSNKVAAANRMALRLAVYSSAVFIPFHCLSSGFSEGFISQLMAICSLLCLRTLYVGLNQLTALDVQYRHRHHWLTRDRIPDHHPATIDDYVQNTHYLRLNVKTYAKRH